MKGIVRTGECIPYCNLLIVAGLAFTPPADRMAVGCGFMKSSCRTCRLLLSPAAVPR